MSRNRKPLGGLSVLVAGAEPSAALIKHDLEEAGARVLGPVSDPRAGLAILGSEHPDAALLDTRVGATIYPLAHALAFRGIPFAFAVDGDGEPLPPAFRQSRREPPVRSAGAVRAVVKRRR